MARDYVKEYADYHSKPEQIANRAKRNHARLEASKAGKVKKGDGKEVDHKVPLSKGGSNSERNTRVVDRHTNRVKGSGLIYSKG
jgi:5-methylcytosine-specific restriction endonuclease McrA